MNTKKFRLFVSLFAIIVLTVGFFACDRVSQIIDPAAPQMPETSEEISVGVVLPLTGRLTDSFGIPTSQGFELALSEINAAHPEWNKTQVYY